MNNEIMVICIVILTWFLMVSFGTGLIVKLIMFIFRMAGGRKNGRT